LPADTLSDQGKEKARSGRGLSFSPYWAGGLLTLSSITSAAQSIGPTVVSLKVETLDDHFPAAYSGPVRSFPSGSTRHPVLRKALFGFVQ
jgi:hypothetical protein